MYRGSRARRESEIVHQESIRHLIDRYLSITFFVTKRAAILVKSELDQDMTTDQFFLLRYIQRCGQCTSTQLADAFVVNKSAITAITNRLVNKGFLERKRDPRDRRLVCLELSPAGKKWLYATEEKIYQLVKKVITHFSQQEIETFINTYEKLNHILREMEEKA
ncbi:regulatory protein MarR [Caldalkalibacillus thermarum TA2.A1]|uniref:Regulatory protein MarR n=1 Tax=Caldalkalibacillus thermarum (strain TA2.A1) TaxID=986075 RepID=F5L4V3_CALTT|nr:regulatory protein MarR [Caldalkalibacillus thermarum TA2.A1]